ncbi:SAF domain-containing protein [Agromyces sp. SYSU K20354]|uniref:SAF domain-containing protein n=1 Tax=Agromyces cavernae TaxID=2898659 RepID=UPI001E3D6277|nr:SAF domain-containing protein [Agromyces cavernae]MCD2444006.1 SAF domain-containing protein [Agromyces cavernae]
MARRTDRERGALRLDPRLIIGIVLIAGSTTGVWALVSGFDDSIEVYVAHETITAGSAVEVDDLAVESVRLGSSAERYLLADAPVGDGLVATRTVQAGEFVPRSAVDEVDRTGLSVVVVPSRGPLPSGLSAGDRIDVWSAAALERGSFEPPKVLISDAEIAGLVESEGMVQADGVSVELLVPREKVAALLEALAAGDAIDLVAARSAVG